MVDLGLNCAPVWVRIQHDFDMMQQCVGKLCANPVSRVGKSPLCASGLIIPQSSRSGLARRECGLARRERGRGAERSAVTIVAILTDGGDCILAAAFC